MKISYRKDRLRKYGHHHCPPPSRKCLRYIIKMLAIKTLSPHSIVWAIFIACRLGMSIVEAGCAPYQLIPTGDITFRMDTTLVMQVTMAGSRVCASSSYKSLQCSNK